MLGRLYILAWLIFAAAGAVLYMAGYDNQQALFIGGIVAATLAFMGPIAVLPWWVDRQFAPKY